MHKRINVYKVSSSANGRSWLMGGRSSRRISSCRVGKSQSELMKRTAREAYRNSPEALRTRVSICSSLGKKGGICERNWWYVLISRNLSVRKRRISSSGAKSSLSSRREMIDRSLAEAMAVLRCGSGRLTIKNLSGNWYRAMEEERSLIKLVWASLSRHSSRPSMTINGGNCRCKK